MGSDQPGSGLTGTEDPTALEPVPCRWCGLSHGVLCPHVKALEFQYTEDGEAQLVRVEFMTPIDYPPQQPAKEQTPDDYPKLKGR